jgi:hypothetical protein
VVVLGVNHHHLQVKSVVAFGENLNNQRKKTRKILIRRRIISCAAMDTVSGARNKLDKS